MAPTAHLLSSLFLYTLVTGVSLSNFTPYAMNLTPTCDSIYKQTIPGCTPDDFVNGHGCSDGCISGLLSMNDAIIAACSISGQDNQSIIGSFLSGNGVSALCPNAIIKTVGAGASSTTMIPSSTSSEGITTTLTTFVHKTSTLKLTLVLTATSSFAFSTTDPVSGATPTSTSIATTTTSTTTPAVSSSTTSFAPSSTSTYARTLTSTRTHSSSTTTSTDSTGQNCQLQGGDPFNYCGGYGVDAQSAATSTLALDESVPMLVMGLAATISVFAAQWGSLSFEQWATSSIIGVVGMAGVLEVVSTRLS